MKNFVTTIFLVLLIEEFITDVSGPPPIPPRIHQEIRDLGQDPVSGIIAEPHDDNARIFDLTMVGPEGSPYEGGIFKLKLTLPDEYPMKPPIVEFQTKIHHPNIRSNGKICLEILGKAWSPDFGIRSVLISIQALLNEKFKGPYAEAGNRKAREVTQLYAMGNTNTAQSTA